MQTCEPVTTEAGRLDAWYNQQRDSGIMRDIKFSLSPEGKEMTVEALAKSVNDVVALRDANRLNYRSGAEIDAFLEQRFG
jgi:hypothetical protein